jgi:hypothetical protein
VAAMGAATTQRGVFSAGKENQWTYAANLFGLYQAGKKYLIISATRQAHAARQTSSTIASCTSNCRDNSAIICPILLSG